MIESWSIWEQETLAEQHGDFEGLVHHLGVPAREAMEADPPPESTGSTRRPGTGRPAAGRPKLRIV